MKTFRRVLDVPDDVVFPVEIVVASEPNGELATAMANASAETARRLGFQAVVGPRVVAGQRIPNNYVITINTI